MEYPNKKWGEVLSIVSGKNQREVVDPNGRYPVYGSGGIMGYANDYLCEAGTTIVGRKGTINNPIFVNERFWNVDTAFGVTPGSSLLPKYLFYFCQLFNFKALDKSTTIPSLAKRDLLNIEMPVPSISEQERIVARIEELFSQLDASINELKTARERLKVYRQAVLKEAFAKYHTFTPLQQVSERIFDGPFGSNLKTADYAERGIRVVRLENLKNAWFDNTKRSFVTEEKYQTISDHTVYPDDLIMSTFISESIKICQLPKEVRFAVNKADCVGIRLKSGINPRFVMFYLSSKQAYDALIHQVHGATRPRVNTKQIKAMQVPVAELQKQNVTVTEIEEKMSICDSIEKTVNTALQQAEALGQSILKKAFEGRL